MIKFGFIDRTGNIVIEPEFDRADGFSEGLACVGVYTDDDDGWHDYNSGALFY